MTKPHAFEPDANGLCKTCQKPQVGHASGGAAQRPADSRSPDTGGDDGFVVGAVVGAIVDAFGSSGDDSLDRDDDFSGGGGDFGGGGADGDF